MKMCVSASVINVKFDRYRSIVIILKCAQCGNDYCNFN